VTLESVFSPIRQEIAEVKRELNLLIPAFDFPATREIVEHFARMPGKFLRPALVLLGAAVVDAQPTADLRKALIRTSCAVELIHDASLVHDDILDEDGERRGQPTINALWGTKVALLTGDLLYSRAFGLLTEVLSADLLHRVVRLNETMCGAEIEQARTLDRSLDRDEYFRIIEGKTAAFLSLCCRLGASLAGGTPSEVEALAEFGLRFGLAFQLFDDQADGDLRCPGVDGVAEGRASVEVALGTLGAFPPSPAADKLRDLCRYLLAANRA
jgi:octaprenyl-diphosphate synthase